MQVLNTLKNIVCLNENTTLMYPKQNTVSRLWCSQVCDGTTPVKARCRVRDSTETFDDKDSASQELEVKCTTQGLLCLNVNQSANATCPDYEIQFTCDGKHLTGSGWHLTSSPLTAW